MNSPPSHPTQSTGSPLPQPGDLPNTDVVIFDGHCRFCTAQVKQLNRLDFRRKLSYLSLHDPSVGQKFPDLQFDQLMDEMCIVTSAGHRHFGAAAFRYLTRRLPALWPLAPVLHIPGSLPIWKFFYRQFAKRRYLFGRTADCDDGACKVHFD